MSVAPAAHRRSAWRITRRPATMGCQLARRNNSLRYKQTVCKINNN